MMDRPAVIYLVDNSFETVYKTVDGLKDSFPGLRVFTGEAELFAAAVGRAPDVVLLNLDLRPSDAINLTSEIRRTQWGASCRIVIYTDKQDDFVQELAFNAGADAFVNFHHKPALMRVFLLNLLKRSAQPATAVQRPLMIDPEAHLVFMDGKPVELPRKEFRLIELLYRGAGRFFTKQEIATEVWHNVSIAASRTIDVHIYNIRRVFGQRVIQSQKGKGYRINRRLI